MKKKWQNVKQWVTVCWQKILGLIVPAVFVAFIFAAYKFKWGWTGISDVPSKQTTVSTSEGAFIITEVQFSKTLWDWFGLLGVFAIPIVVGLGTALYTSRQEKIKATEVKENQQEAAGIGQRFVQKWAICPGTHGFHSLTTTNATAR